jgi:hypothetical protein
MKGGGDQGRGHQGSVVLEGRKQRKQEYRVEGRKQRKQEYRVGMPAAACSHLTPSLLQPEATPHPALAPCAAEEPMQSGLPPQGGHLPAQGSSQGGGGPRQPMPKRAGRTAHSECGSFHACLCVPHMRLWLLQARAR